MLDLVVRRTRLHKPTHLSSIAGDQTDQNTLVDVAIQGGKIVDIAPNLDAEAAKEIDASGYLLTPPFVDPHFHMDATLSLGIPRLNVSGTLLEGIALWGELKPQLTVAAVKERALRYCDLAVSQGFWPSAAMSMCATTA
jgi:cytosine deaminase